MIQVMDYLVSLSCTISDGFILLSALVTGNFTYILYTNDSQCSMLLVSIHGKGYCDTSDELLYVHKIFLDSQCKDGYPGSCGEFEKCKKK